MAPGADGVDRLFCELALVAQRCQEVHGQAHLWVERTRPQPRKLDIRPYLSDLRVRDQALEIVIWVTPTGTARPEELARFLGLGALLDAGAYFERSDLEMMDEVTAPLPELTRNHEESPGEDSALPRPDAEPASKPAVRPTALLAGPLAFDS